MKMPKILFFIASYSPTPAEQEAALEIGIVAMRNRSMIDTTTNMEACDAVAGENIPAQYAGKPVVKTLAHAITILRDKQKAENAKAAADLANAAPTPIVGKEGTAPEKEGKGKMAATGWKANA